MPRLRKGCGRGNTSALMLRRVLKAGARTRKDGNELVRSCKNECRRGGAGRVGVEMKSRIGNEPRIPWDSCASKKAFSVTRPASLALFSFSPGGHESEAGQQPEEESQRD